MRRLRARIVEIAALCSCRGVTLRVALTELDW